MASGDNIVLLYFLTMQSALAFYQVLNKAFSLLLQKGYC